MIYYVAIQVAILAAVAIFHPQVFGAMVLGGGVIAGGFYVLGRWLGFWKPKGSSN